MSWTPDVLDQVFQPFFTTKPNGLGFDLAVCRTIIAAHGGKLWGANNPEGGATFHFTLHPAGSGEKALPVESPDVVRTEASL